MTTLLLLSYSVGMKNNLLLNLPSIETRKVGDNKLNGNIDYILGKEQLLSISTTNLKNCDVLEQDQSGSINEQERSLYRTNHQPLRRTQTDLPLQTPNYTKKTKRKYLSIIIIL